MPDNKKPSVNQKITATKGGRIENVNQEIHIDSSDIPSRVASQVPSLTEDPVISDGTTLLDIVATIVHFIINVALWLGSWLPALFWTKAVLSVFPAYADDPTTPISLLVVIALIILTIPWVPEKILRIKKMSLSLKFIYAWVMGFIVLLIMMIIAENTEL